MNTHTATSAHMQTRERQTFTCAHAFAEDALSMGLSERHRTVVHCLVHEFGDQGGSLEVRDCNGRRRRGPMRGCRRGWLGTALAGARGGARLGHGHPASNGR